MKSSTIRYEELARAKVQPNRSLVISECSKNGFTIAQQLEIKEGNHTMNVFLKEHFTLTTFTVCTIYETH